MIIMVAAIHLQRKINFIKTTEIPVFLYDPKDHYPFPVGPAKFSTDPRVGWSPSRVFSHFILYLRAPTNLR